MLVKGGPGDKCRHWFGLDNGLVPIQHQAIVEININILTEKNHSMYSIRTVQNTEMLIQEGAHKYVVCRVAAILV